MHTQNQSQVNRFIPFHLSLHYSCDSELEKSVKGNPLVEIHRKLIVILIAGPLSAFHLYLFCLLTNETQQEKKLSECNSITSTVNTGSVIMVAHKLHHFRMLLHHLNGTLNGIEIQCLGLPFFGRILNCMNKNESSAETTSFWWAHIGRNISAIILSSDDFAFNNGSNSKPQNKCVCFGFCRNI